jgi:hypothetical protein
MRKSACPLWPTHPAEQQSSRNKHPGKTRPLR